MAFRFETLLRIRKNHEDQLQKDFAQAQTHFLAQEDRLRFMRDVENKSSLEVTQKMDKGVNINTLILYDHFFNALDSQKARQNQIISEVAAHVETKRKALVEAVKNRQTLEVLKERDLMAEKKKREKQEIALLDEVGSILWRNNPR